MGLASDTLTTLLGDIFRLASRGSILSGSYGFCFFKRKAKCPGRLLAYGVEMVGSYSRKEYRENGSKRLMSLEKLCAGPTPAIGKAFLA
jgi:hypothetical protein